MIEFRYESEMLDPLIRHLERSGRVKGDTISAAEFRWFGRRVDFATLSRTRRTTAYELKISNNFRAVEQAAYNKLAFDKSYIVTATEPSKKVVDFAEEEGVGILVLTRNSIKFHLKSSNEDVPKCLRKKLLFALRTAADSNVRK